MEKCLHCKKETEDSVRISEWTGFCHQSGDRPLCGACERKLTKVTEHGLFLLLKPGVVYFSRGLFSGGFERVRTKFQLDRIFNKDYNEILDCVQGVGEHDY